MFGFREISKRTKDLSAQELGASGGHFLVPSRKWIRIRPKRSAPSLLPQPKPPPLGIPQARTAGSRRNVLAFKLLLIEVGNFNTILLNF